MRLLLVEDSARLRELVCETIREAGWSIDAVGTAAEAAAALDAAEYDVALVDLGLPDGDGVDLVRSFRRRGRTLPVLMLTARAAIDERIAGLDAGADDYLTKPFNNGELLARIRALLRRAPQVSMPVLAFGCLAYDPAAARLECEGTEIALPPRERALVEILMRNAGRTVPKRRLENAFSEFGEEKSPNAVELAVSRLRRRLEPFDTGVVIETVRGIGYLLTEAPCTKAP